MWFSPQLHDRQCSSLSARLGAQGSRRQRLAFRPALGALEDRRLPSTLTVSNDLDSGPGSLRAEIAAAHSSDTIAFASGLDGTTITLSSGELVINTSLTIQGPGASQLAISGGGVSRVFEVGGASTNVTLSGLTITHGNGLGGTLPYYGGGIFNNGCTLTLNGCTLSQNSVADLGGGIESIGTLTVTNCNLSTNQALEGGGIASDAPQGKATASATLSGCNLSGNFASDGGGIATGNATMTISGCTLSGNSAGTGGGIYNYGTVTVSGCMLSGNSAEAGGGVYNSNGATATITNSTLSDNIALGGDYGEGYGGGIDNNYGTVTMSGSTLSGNTAYYGGAAYTICQVVHKKAVSSLTMTGCTVTGNSAEFGGGFFNASSGGTDSGLTLIITNCTLSNNGPSLSIAYVGPFGGSGDTFS